jgi:hypothetical protein
MVDTLGLGYFRDFAAPRDFDYDSLIVPPGCEKAWHAASQAP